jgi:hypothetical protein
MKRAIGSLPPEDRPRGEPWHLGPLVSQMAARAIRNMRMKGNRMTVTNKPEISLGHSRSQEYTPGCIHLSRSSTLFHLGSSPVLR